MAREALPRGKASLTLNKSTNAFHTGLPRAPVIFVTSRERRRNVCRPPSRCSPRGAPWAGSRSWPATPFAVLLTQAAASGPHQWRKNCLGSEPEAPPNLSWGRIYAFLGETPCVSEMDSDHFKSEDHTHTSLVGPWGQFPKKIHKCGQVGLACTLATQLQGCRTRRPLGTICLF